MLELREETRVSNAVQEASERWARAHEAWEFVTWLIARDPSCGSRLTESGDLRVLFWGGGRSIGMPDIRVTYRVSDNLVELEDAKFSEAKYAFAGRA